MSEEVTKPEGVTDDQLEEVAGGLSNMISIQNPNCSALAISIAVA